MVRRGIVSKVIRNLVRACRFPEFSPSTYRTLREEGGEDRESASYPYSGFEMGLFTATIMILLLLGPLWSITQFSPIDGTIIEGPEIVGLPGHSISTPSHTGSHEAVILNSTPFMVPGEWMALSFSEQFSNGYSGEDGYHVEILPGIPWNEVWFSYPHHTSLEDYSEVEYRCKARLLSGSATLNLDITYAEMGYWSEIVEKSNSTLLEMGQSFEIQLSAPLALLRTISDQWLQKTTARLRINSSGGGHLVVESVEIIATSPEPLYPLAIDIQTTANESLFDNPFTAYLLDLPRVSLARQGEPSGSNFVPIRCNDTLYLRSGQYAAIAGWLSHSDYRSLIEPYSFNLTLDGDHAVLATVQIRTVKLFFDVDPRVPFRSLNIESGYYMGGYGEYGSLPDFLYLAPRTSIHIRLRLPQIVQYDLLFPSGRVYSSVTVQANPDNQHDLTMRIRLNMLPIFGAAVGIGQLVVYIILGLLVAAVWYRLKNLSGRVSLRHAYGNIRFPSFLVLMMSALLPWTTDMNSMFGTDAVAPSSVDVYGPLPLVAVNASGAYSVHILPALWYVWFLFAVGLFWIPFARLLLEILHPESMESESTIPRTLLWPTVFAAIALVFAFFGGAMPSYGLVLAASALPIWALQTLVRRGLGQRALSLNGEEER